MNEACNFVIEDFLRPVIDIKVAKPYSKDFITVKALLDTGSMRSAVNKITAEKLELKEYGSILVSTVTGKNLKVSLTSLRVRFPFNYEYEDKEVLISNVNEMYDFIIGMDILSTMDMVISNKDEKMVISLRYPPSEIKLFCNDKTNK